MKRFHIHLRVDDLAANIEFYSNLFATQPSVTQPDYAKWMLDDPYINFALSTHGDKTGINHIGIEIEDQASFDALLKSREMTSKSRTQQVPQEDANCCYAQSRKLWLVDPQDTAWEIFHTHDSLETYGKSDTKCSILQQAKETL
jgi:hypothetical protein